MTWERVPLDALTEQRIDQGGAAGAEFTYIDISGVDNKTKRITEPKTLPSSKAPSRARQRLRAGDVLVSMTRPNLNAVALVPAALASRHGGASDRGKWHRPQRASPESERV